MLFEAASQGFATATKNVGYVAAGLIALGLISAFFLPSGAARTEAAGYISAKEEEIEEAQAEADADLGEPDPTTTR